MQRPLRIALIRQRYTPFGGAERFVENAIKSLQTKGEVELTLITRKWNESNNSTLKTIICNPFYIGRLWRDWSFSRCACKTIRKFNFDLVQSHERIPCGDIYRAGDGVHRQWLQQRAQTKTWWKNLWYRVSPYHRFVLWQEQRTFTQPKLQAIIVNSNVIKREIQQWFPQISASINTIYNGVNTNHFHPELRIQYRQNIRDHLSIDDKAPLLLFIGSGFERKGVPLLLKMLPNLHNMHLVVVGKERQIKRYQRYAKQQGIEKRVHFVGPQKDTRPWYGAADLFVFPSLYDPLPNTVLEAMATGLPVIVSKTCGASDLVENGKHGYVLDPTRSDIWTETINNTILSMN